MSDIQNTARLLISCPDKAGIVAAVSQFLYAQGANILDAAQHSTDPSGGTFFMRMVFQLDGLDAKRDALEEAFTHEVADKFAMNWRLAYTADTKRMVILVSKYDHALLELLWRQQNGDLAVEIPAVISNHNTLRPLVESFGIPFHHLPVTKATKPQQEAQLAELVKDTDIIVLARYMQILSEDFVDKFGERSINIHHSFLPAFVGANPYKHAYNRGVKLIGATAHFVTADLDEGPIIEQDVRRVTHRDDRQDLVSVGREVERTVLARAVKAFAEDRVLVHENKTIVFD